MKIHIIFNSFFFYLMLGFFVCIDQKTSNTSLIPGPNTGNYIEGKLLQKRSLMTLVENGKMLPNGELVGPYSSVIQIKAFQGKYLIIDFWATWCAPCLEQT